MGLVALAWLLVTRWLSVFTESINWDEFALLARAESTLRLGQVAGGGRPGLVSVILVPFVKDCVDSVRAVVQARVVWQVITLAYLGGVYFLVRRWFIQSGRADEGRIEGLLAVALLAFLPAFVTWSVQVRTDQAALAAATWGGVLLLSPANRSAAIAGLLFGVSILCSQKGLYAIGLCGLLVLTASASRMVPPSTATRAEVVRLLARAGLAAAGIAATLGLYTLLVPKAANLASGAGLSSSFEVMDWVRSKLGYRAYTVNASRLLVHWLLFTTLVLWTSRAVFRRDRSEAMLLVTCWAVLGLGVVVIRIHGSSFPYFLMTAGLFPAVALGMSAGRPLALAGAAQWKLVAVLVFALIAKSAPETVEMLQGSQERQRNTLKLIRSSELSELRGFQNESALFCTGDPQPLPTLFTHEIERRRMRGPGAFEGFTEEFRMRPIAYIVDSYRMRQFPVAVQQFWQSHYVRHSGALYVAGFRVQPGTPPNGVEVIASGKYRWIPSGRDARASLRIGDQVVAPLGTFELQAGWHRIETDPPHASGTVMLAISAQPSSDYYSFYDPRQVDQLRGEQ